MNSEHAHSMEASGTPVNGAVSTTGLPVEVLLLDDDAVLRGALAEVMQEDGFSVHAYGAPAGVPALDTLGRIAVVVTDYEMPHESGLDFADRFHAAYPDVPIVLLTGHSSQALAAELRTRSFLYYCPKPIGVDDFTAMLAKLANR